MAYDEVKLDLIPAVLSAMVKLHYMYDAIDNCYYKCLKVCKEIEKHYDIEGSVFYKNLPEQQKIYYRKLYVISAAEIPPSADGLFEWLKDNADLSEFVKLVKKGYKKIYQQVKKAQGDVLSFKDVVPVKNFSDPHAFETFLDGCGIALFFMVLQGKTLNPNDGMSNEYIRFLDGYSKETLYGLSFNNFNKEEKAFVNKAYQKLKDTGFTIGDIYRSGGYSTLKEALTTGAMECLGYEPTLLNILYPCTEQDVKKLLLIKYGYDSEVIADELFNQYVISGCMITSLVKAYKECGALLRKENYDHSVQLIANETLKKDIAQLINEKSALKTLLTSREAEITEMKKLLEASNKQLKTIESTKKEDALNKEELYALRELMFEMEQEESVYPEEAALNENIEDAMVVFGGHPGLIAKLKSRMIHSTFVGADQMNFSLDLVRRGDPLVIMVGYLSHPMYYKIINEARSVGNKLIYINRSSNENAVLREIAQKR